jgi:hypothetical protein
MDDGHEQGTLSDEEWQRPCDDTADLENMVAPDESLDDDGDFGSVQRSLEAADAAAALQARTLQIQHMIQSALTFEN